MEEFVNNDSPENDEPDSEIGRQDTVSSESDDEVVPKVPEESQT